MSPSNTSDAEDRDRELRLYDALQGMQGQEEMSFLGAVRWLRERGEHLGVADVMSLKRRFWRDVGSPAAPSWASRFVVRMVQSYGARSLLDPSGGDGLLAASLAEQTQFERVDVVCRDPGAQELLAVLDTGRMNLLTGRLQDVETQLSEAYGAIVSFPPIGHSRERRLVTTEQGEMRVSDEPSALLILDVAKRLSPEGVIIFLVSPRWSWDLRRAPVKRALPAAGLHLSALLRLPAGTFTGTSIACDLAVIERIERTDLFVAEVPDHPEAQEQLIARLHDRKEGPSPSQGRLVDPRKYRGIDALQAEEMLRRLASSRGLQAVPFKTAVLEIRRPRGSGANFQPCADHPDAVYLAEMANTPATTSQAELSERLQSYLQLIVDRWVALPEYIAAMLNTPLGHALRESAMTGMTVPRINREWLKASNLYLPPLRDQESAIETLRRIRLLQAELGELESRIWERPRRANQVFDALSRVNHEERFGDWIESLPFPLASILRGYYAARHGDREKYERLLHFFEALAAFCATIHLSAYRSNSGLWNTWRPEIAETLHRQGLTLSRSTFGVWRAILEILAGETRKLANGKPEDQALCGTLYRLSDLEPLRRLCSGELLGVLQEANRCGNLWSGHGGAQSREQSRERHKHLRAELDKVRAAFGRTFCQYELVQPDQPQILEGPVYRYSGRRIMGSNPRFERREFELTDPATTGGLYMHSPGHDRALQLLGLVQMKEKAQPACYFYNRVDGEGVHLTSYHLSEEPDVTDGNELRALISELEPGRS